MLHHGLAGIGKFIGLITRLALIVGLVGAPVLALVMSGLLAAIWLSELFGLSPFIEFMLFSLIAFVISFYVAPHVQPHIGKAVFALLDLPDDEPSSP